MRRAVALLLMVAAVGCMPRRHDESRVVEAAFDAIHGKSFAAFQAIAITMADLVMRDQKVKPFQKQQTFAGSVLKPEELAVLAQRFDLVVQGKVPGAADVTRAKFVRAGTGTAQTFPLPDGSPVTVRIFWPETTIDGETVPSERRIGFAVVPWGTQYRVIGILFPGDLRTSG